MFAIPMPIPSDMPHESTEMEVKLAAALEAAASAAQGVADECHKAVEEAQGAGLPVIETSPVNLREIATLTTETVIKKLKDINSKTS
jgi:hypothetical protein